MGLNTQMLSEYGGGSHEEKLPCIRTRQAYAPTLCTVNIAVGILH
jgi:hypothetical protein